MSYELRGLRSTQSHGPWQISLQFYRFPLYQPHEPSSQDQANHWAGPGELQAPEGLP